MTILRCPNARPGVGPGSRSSSPSPGAYDAAHGETLSARTRRTFNTSASGGKASFGTFTKRDDKSKSGGGDPGLYTVETPGVHTGKAETLSSRSRRSFNRDVNQGRGSFNSTSARSNTPPARSARGGPGEHDYMHMYSCGSPASTQVTSSFLSAMPLGGHVRKSDTPGVGEYEPNNVEGFNASKSGMSMFAGSLKSRSVSSRSATGDHVGPGSYELEQRSIRKQMEASTNPRLPAFGSSSMRTGPGDD